MALNQYKKRENKFKGLIKGLLFGTGVRQRTLLFGKARGLKMLIDPATKIQLLTGIYEREIQTYFAGWAKQCGHFFDVGAGDGYYGLFYKKYAPDGMAYLFDPDPRAAGIQQDHFDRSGIRSGYSLHKARVSAHQQPGMATLNSFALQAQNILIKIDVEGVELEVLHGADRLLNNNHCFLLIETHALQLEQDAIAFLQRLGYHTKIIKNAWWRFFIPERRPLAHNRWLAAWKDV
ncbi:MAG TPA: FkbM family methyltransferase [Chitinophagaceae bacterium]|nr:FkbM family methyltransferase [Chitinophagaceae bacterium]